MQHVKPDTDRAGARDSVGCGELLSSEKNEHGVREIARAESRDRGEEPPIAVRQLLEPFTKRNVRHWRSLPLFDEQCNNRRR